MTAFKKLKQPSSLVKQLGSIIPYNLATHLQAGNELLAGSANAILHIDRKNIRIIRVNLKRDRYLSRGDSLQKSILTSAWKSWPNSSILGIEFPGSVSIGLQPNRSTLELVGNNR